MKKLPVLVMLLITVAAIGLAGMRLGGSAYQLTPSPEQPLSHFLPGGAVLFLQARDFSSLLADWNRSPEKQAWLVSSNYEVFSRSRLLLRLRDAGKQFASAAGLPPDMDFLNQVAGSQSALALYDIGKLQFLYITRLASANSMQSQLWQTRSKFESRSAGGTTFYLRRDPESGREVAFAANGDYLLLSTREDLMAGALQLMAANAGHDSTQDPEMRNIETDSWWSQSAAAAGPAGDLRMIMNLEKIVPSPYFRSYWVQQNITDMKEYSSAVSDLFRSKQEYREERVLLKRAAGSASASDQSDDVTDLVRLVPEGTGFYQAEGCPSIESCLDPLETSLLTPQLAAAPAGQLAPQAQLTSGETGATSDLETRIDQKPEQGATDSKSSSALKTILRTNQVSSILQVRSTERRDKNGVFVNIHSAVSLAGSSDWDEVDARRALAEFVRPILTASQLGVGWRQMNGYYELDGLRTLSMAVRGKYLLISDDEALINGMLANMNRKVDLKPAEFVAGFDHRRERQNFVRLAAVVDRPDWNGSGGVGPERQPQFFSENIASLSSTLSGISSEKIVVRNAGDRLLQTVTYEWSH
jgi:hypothetical protein